MARQPKQAKPELVLAYWPEGRGTEVFGNGKDYNGDLSGSAAFSLAVRGMMPDPESYVSSDSECSAMTDLILRVYVNANGDGTKRADAKLIYGTIFYADERQMEVRTKLLKRLNAQASKAGYFGGKGDVLPVLAQACEAYGIKRAVVYRAGTRGREVAPLAVVLNEFARVIEARCMQCPGFARKAAND